MQLLPALSPSQLSRQLRRLRVLGVIKRAANTYRYYLTRAGRLVIAACERLAAFVIIPAIARAGPQFNNQFGFLLAFNRCQIEKL